MGRKPNPSQRVIDESERRYQQTLQPTELENEYGAFHQGFQNRFNQAADRQTADYGNIMSGYQDFSRNLGSPRQFSFERVSAARPAELDESYGYLREAMPHYREFADTGGYSEKDQRELRARGVAPIRSAYANTMMELDRARSLGGSGGSPNYIAAASRAQREMPGQMADAMTTVNAGLADAIRQGRMFGISGISNTGATMGGLSSAEAGRQLQAAMANQGADLQSQGMTEQSLQNHRQAQLASLGGQSSLFGTTPGMASTFGNQALQSWQNRMGMENNRNVQGLAYMDNQLRGHQGTKGTPWWQTALKVAGTAAPYVAMAFSSRELKDNIKPVKNTSKFAKHLKDLPLYTWKYKGDDVTHFGPIAEEFKEKFGIGDGKTMHLADVMGVMLAAGKEVVANA